MNIRLFLCSCLIVISAFCHAESKTFTGLSTVDAKDWFLGDNWSDLTVPTSSDEVEISGKTVNITNAVVVSSLTLSSKATLNVTARPLPDTSPFATGQAAAMAALWANRLVVKVTGALTVSSGCTLKPQNDKLTGELVAFEVGSADIAGTVDAKGAGWGWTALGDGTLPDGAFKQHANGKDVWYYTFAFGAGTGDTGWYGMGASHGGKGSDKNARDPYGLATAPFMPGSQSTLYGTQYNTRGGGSVVIHATGTISLTGTITAIGNRDGQNAGTSGGGVWLAASSIVRSDTSLINANGEAGANGSQGQGGGGRICLTLGASAAELAAFANGTIPETFTINDLAAENVTVAAGSSAASPGTMKEAVSVNLRATLTTRSNVGGLSAAGITWGDEVLMNGTYSRTAPQYAVLIEDPTIRYACQGYVLSNKTGQVSASSERTVEFTIDGRYGPYSLTWLWGDRTEIDPDPVNRRWVGAAGGSVTEPTNWDPVGVPTRADSIFFTNATVAISSLNVSNVVISGGTVTVGSLETRADVAFAVRGDVAFCDGAQVSFYAPKKSDPTAYTSVEVARGLLWTNRTRIKVGGTLSVSGGATVKIANDPETGDLVVFDVGAFDLAADGAMNADGTGFAQLKKGDKTFEEGTTVKIGTAYFDKTEGVACYTYGFGTKGTGYGASGLHDYGYEFAPFEPGSPGGADSKYKPSIGGGSVVVLAKGAVTLAGTLSADADLNGSTAGPSGGSVWVAGATLDLADGLVVSAQGKSHTHWAYAEGAGGRVALMSEVTTAEQIETLVAGTKLTGHTYDALSFAGLRIKAVTSSGGERGFVGTAVRGYDASNYEAVTETAVPLEATSALAKYGSSAVGGGQTVTRTITEIGGDLTDPANVRYVCTGYVVSNATEEIAAGTTRELAFTVVKGAGPYKITWLWGVRETRSQVSVTGPGTVTVNGESANEAWTADDANVTFVATPTADKTFWTWVGSNVSRAQSAQLNMAILADKPHVVRAVFCDTAAEAKTCTCTSTAKDDFYDPANWTDGVVPNPQDKIVLSAGDLKVSRRFACSALTLTGSAKLSAEVIDEIAIAGNVCLSNSAVWTVTAQPTNTATAFADGATRVNITGDFVVADTASVKPVCDTFTGGTVVFNVKSFSLDAGASVNADEAGWNWVDYTGEPAAGATTHAYKDDSKGYDIHRQTLAIGRGEGYGSGGSHAQKGGVASGPAYGFANSPVLPGSPNGCYAQYDPHRGGGLIRIHVQGAATVNGALTADGCLKNTYGGPSGGGIWLTAKTFSFGEAAVMRARGGNSAYGYSFGSGGRIAIGRSLTDDDIAGLAATGVFEPARRVKDEAYFRGQIGNAEMTIDVRPNSTDSGRIANLTGTFVYIDGKRNGLVLLFR